MFLLYKHYTVDISDVLIVQAYVYIVGIRRNVVMLA